MTDEQRQAAEWWCSMNRWEIPDGDEFKAWLEAAGMSAPKDCEHGRNQLEFAHYSDVMSTLLRAAGGHRNCLEVWSEHE